MGQLESEAQKFSTKADIIGSSMYHNEYLELGEQYFCFEFFETNGSKIEIVGVLTDYDGDIPAFIPEKYFLMVNFDAL